MNNFLPKKSADDDAETLAETKVATETQTIPAENTKDEVDQIVAAWESQRADFDAQPLAIFSRLLRLGRHLDRIRRSTFAAHNLETWEFEMLAALRRVGEPYRLTAGQLMEETLVSSGTITNRIDRMQARGLVERESTAADRRVVYVKATAKGIAAVDVAMSDLLSVQRDLLSNFSHTQKETAREFLKTMLELFEK